MRGIGKCTGKELKVLRELLGLGIKETAYICSCTQKTLKGVEAETISDPRTLMIYNWYLFDESCNDLDVLLRFEEKLKQMREEGAL